MKESSFCFLKDTRWLNTLITTLLKWNIRASWRTVRQSSYLACLRTKYINYTKLLKSVRTIKRIQQQKNKALGISRRYRDISILSREFDAKFIALKKTLALRSFRMQFPLLTRNIFSYWVTNKKNKRFSNASHSLWTDFSDATRPLEILLYAYSSDLCLFRSEMVTFGMFDGEALAGVKPINCISSSSFLWAGKIAKLRLFCLDSLLFLRAVICLLAH